MAAPIVDVRPEPDFLAAHRAGSVNIPLEQLASRLYELPEKGAALAVHDPDPARAEGAAGLLKKRGYQVQVLTHAAYDAQGQSRARLWSPSPLLEEAASLIAKPGEAADLACGSGREAVWLALASWQVSAYDILPDALANARRLADRCGATLLTEQRDLHRDPNLGEARFDLITLFRFWHAPLIAHAVRALRPGGLLVIEAFSPEDAAGDPRREAKRLVSPEQAIAAAAGTKPIVARTHQRNGRWFTQVIAQR